MSRQEKCHHIRNLEWPIFLDLMSSRASSRDFEVVTGTLKYLTWRKGGVEK